MNQLCGENSDESWDSIEKGINPTALLWLPMDCDGFSSASPFRIGGELKNGRIWWTIDLLLPLQLFHSPCCTEQFKWQRLESLWWISSTWGLKRVTFQFLVGNSIQIGHNCCWQSVGGVNVFIVLRLLSEKEGNENPSDGTIPVLVWTRLHSESKCDGKWCSLSYPVMENRRGSVWTMGWHFTSRSCILL